MGVSSFTGQLGNLVDFVLGTSVEQLAKRDLGEPRAQTIAAEFSRTKQEIARLSLLSDHQKAFISRAATGAVGGFDGFREAIGQLTQCVSQLGAFSSASPLPNNSSFAQEQERLSNAFVDANTRFIVELARLIQPFMAHEVQDPGLLALAKNPALNGLITAAPEIHKFLASRDTAEVKKVTSPLENKFLSQADAKLWEGYAWLGASVVFLCLTFYFVFDLLGMSPDFVQSLRSAAGLEIYHFAMSGALRIVLFGTLLFSLLRCADLFRAAKHQRSVLLHRATALSHVDTIGNSALDPDVRRAVLIEATKAIYTLGETGYERGTSDTERLNVVELLGSQNAVK